MDSPATAHFLTRALPAIAAASPALAALHVTRVRRTLPDTELSPLHCPRCGSLALRTRLQRQSRSPRVSRTNKGKDKRAERGQRSPPPSHCTSIRRTCAACGFTDAQAVANTGDTTRAGLKDRFPKTASARANAHLSSFSAQARSPDQAPTSSQRSSDNVTETSAKVKIAVETKASVQSTSSNAQSPVVNAPRVRASAEQPRDMPSSPSSASVPSKRSKKRSGLQEMLARSREQKRKKEDDAPGSGLAGFLSGL